MQTKLNKILIILLHIFFLVASQTLMASNSRTFIDLSNKKGSMNYIDNSSVSTKASSSDSTKASSSHKKIPLQKTKNKSDVEVKCQRFYHGYKEEKISHYLTPVLQKNSISTERPGKKFIEQKDTQQNICVTPFNLGIKETETNSKENEKEKKLEDGINNTVITKAHQNSTEQPASDINDTKNNTHLKSNNTFKKLVVTSNVALKYTFAVIDNIIDNNFMFNAKTSRGEKESTKFNLLGKVFRASATSKKVASDNLSSRGFVLGGGYQLTDNILLGIFGGRNFANIPNAATIKIGKSFLGLYSKIDLSPKVNVQIKAGALKVDLDANDATGKKIPLPSNNLFAAFITNYNIQLSSSLGVVVTLGVKALQTFKCDDLLPLESNKPSLQNNKFFLFGASVFGRKIVVNKITLTPTLHIFKELALDENYKDIISKNDSGSFKMGGLLSAEYANSQFNVGVELVNFDNYSGFVGQLNTKINF